MKSKSMIRRKIACMLSLLLLLCGCAQEFPEAPKLLEALDTNESYRPVEYGDVGIIELRYGIVVPTEYAHFWKSQVTVGEISVSVGDYVEVGEVIATADALVVEQERQRLSDSLEQENAIFAVNEQIYEKNKQMWEYKLAGSQEIGDAEGEDDARTRLTVLEEDHRYDTLLHQRRVERMQEDLAVQNELVTDGTLRARISGYVTYVKDITDSRIVRSTENLVVIADYNDCYVELTDQDVSQNILLDRMTSCYTNISGEKCFLEEYPYEKNELLVADSKKKYPKIRFCFVHSEDMPEAGSNIPIFFQTHTKEDVLLVGLDSCYEDLNGSFVYVLDGDKREQRYVELGIQDSFYVEVISGLKEGELVYYSSDSILPEEYGEYTVTSSDYIVENESKSYEVKDTQSLNVYSGYDGQLTALYVSEKTKVQKGDLIGTIKVNEGSARLAEMREEIQNYKESHTSLLESYQEQIADIEAQQSDILAARNHPTEAIQGAARVEIATNTDAVKPGENMPQDPYFYEELGLQVDILRLEQKRDEIQYQYQLADMETEYEEASNNNDGVGNIYIYADETGIISRLVIREGGKVTYGQRMFCIDVASKTQVLLSAPSELTLGQEVTFTDHNKSYIGHVTGSTGQSANGRVYVTTENEKVYITENLNSNRYARYYVTLEDESFFSETGEKMFAIYSLRTIRNTVVLPDGVVNTYIRMPSADEVYFVWKIVDGNLVKQYITITRDHVDGKTYTCAISGLKPGDVLAQEVHE